MAAQARPIPLPVRYGVAQVPRIALTQPVTTLSAPPELLHSSEQLLAEPQGYFMSRQSMTASQAADLSWLFSLQVLHI